MPLWQEVNNTFEYRIVIAPFLPLLVKSLFLDSKMGERLVLLQAYVKSASENINFQWIVSGPLVVARMQHIRKALEKFSKSLLTFHNQICLCIARHFSSPLRTICISVIRNANKLPACCALQL